MYYCMIPCMLHNIYSNSTKVKKNSTLYKIFINDRVTRIKSLIKVLNYSSFLVTLVSYVLISMLDWIMYPTLLYVAFLKLNSNSKSND